MKVRAFARAKPGVEVFITGHRLCLYYPELGRCIAALSCGCCWSAVSILDGHGGAVEHFLEAPVREEGVIGDAAGALAWLQGDVQVIPTPVKLTDPGTDGSLIN